MRKTAVILACDRCGGSFERKLSHISAHNYCSRQCRAQPAPSEEELRRQFTDRTATDLARLYGVDRDVVRRWMRLYSIPPRSISEAKRIWAASMPPEERQRLAAAAPLTMTPLGAKKPHEWLIKRALGVERVGAMSAPERKVYEAMRGWGITPVPAKAVDKFNIDLAVPERMIAVEVDGGNWHTRHSPRKMRQDETKRLFLEPLGWTVVRVRAQPASLWRRDLEALRGLLAA